MKKQIKINYVGTMEPKKDEKGTISAHSFSRIVKYAERHGWSDKVADILKSEGETMTGDQKLIYNHALKKSIPSQYL